MNQEEQERAEILEREKMIFEDPREKPRTGSTIIRLQAGRMDVETIPEVLISHLGMAKSDATKVCMQEGGIPVDNVDPAVAEALAADLRAQGEDCFIIPADHVVPLPRAKQVHSLQWDQEQVGFIDTSSRVEQAPWEKTIVTALAQVLMERVEKKSTDNAGARILGTAVGMAAGGVVGAMWGASTSARNRTRIVKSTEIRILFDLVVLGPLRRYRIDSRQFDYTILGDAICASSAENMRVLAGWLLQLATQARSNVSAQELAGEQVSRLPKHSRHGMDDLVHWMINMVRFRPEG